jgi:hypothetical protein
MRLTSRLRRAPASGQTNRPKRPTHNLSIVERVYGPTAAPGPVMALRRKLAYLFDERRILIVTAR